MFKIIAIFLLSICVCESARILFISSSISRSTVLPMQTLAKEMAQRNHEVAVVSMFPENVSIKNYREFKIELEPEDQEVHSRLAKLLSANDKRMEIISFLPNAFKTLFKIGNDTLQSKIIDDLKKEKFDLVMISYFFSEYLLGLADHFQCPSVVFFSAGPFSALHKMVGNPLSPEASNHFLISSEELNFFGRIKNFLVNSFDVLVLRNVAYFKGKQIFE
jgi:UDP:flavonoid glycosyltransferase YjiC (YdhE family)